MTDKLITVLFAFAGLFAVYSLVMDGSIVIRWFRGRF